MKIYMIIYIVTLLMLILSVVSSNKFFLKLNIVFIILLTMIRFDTGFDFYWYWLVSNNEKKYFYEVQRMYRGLEIGHKIFVDIARYLNEPQVYFAITGFITLILIMLRIKRAKYPELSLAIFMVGNYFYKFSLGFIRQYLAIAIIFYFSQKIEEKENNFFLFVVLFTALFIHPSAIICLLYFLILRIKITFVRVGVFSLLSIQFFSIIKYFIVNYLPKYSYYLEKNNFSNFSLKEIYLYILIIACIEFLKFILKIKLDEKYYIYKQLFYLGIILSIIFSKFGGGHLPTRVGIYFYIYSILLIPYILDFFSQKKILEIILISIFLLYGVLNTYKQTVYFQNVNREVVKERSYVEYKLFFGKKEEDIHLKLLP